MALRNFKISKSLTKSDISSKPALPSEMVDHINPVMNGQHFVDLMVADIRGHKWPLRYYTRPNGNKKGPVFTNGWREFAREKNVQVGDELTFYGHQVRDDDGELKMKYMIEVKRIISMTFKGQPNIITLDVEYLPRD
ncbi:hypothetical protein LWI28_023293 [Acer negundo]|uniref:TF-B3 domain-containing protein n=1 Tax=Acer negundo TaxID=4023 RepID=A0AAD5NWH3_ACENE|nr:hypothetical protein LWI28_023293 [Acer negundo]KAK4849863.1 hypothetical protein QYF36_001466 [Acer negundo]